MPQNCLTEWWSVGVFMHQTSSLIKKSWGISPLEHSAWLMGLAGSFGRESPLADRKAVCSDLQGRLKAGEWSFVNTCYRQIKVILKVIDKRKIPESIPVKWMLISRKKMPIVFELSEKKIVKLNHAKLASLKTNNKQSKTTRMVLQ